MFGTTEQEAYGANIGGTSISEAQRKRDEAVASVTANATPGFRAQLIDAVKTVATTRSRFTVDDVWVHLETTNIAYALVPATIPGDRRALGGIMRILEKEGVIRQTGYYRPSPRRHMTPQRVWRRA